MTVKVVIPDPVDVENEVIVLEEFETREEAIEWLKEILPVDDEGKFDLLVEDNSDEDFDEEEDNDEDF